MLLAFSLASKWHGRNLHVRLCLPSTIYFQLSLTVTEEPSHPSGTVYDRFSPPSQSTSPDSFCTTYLYSKLVLVGRLTVPCHRGVTLLYSSALSATAAETFHDPRAGVDPTRATLSPTEVVTSSLKRTGTAVGVAAHDAVGQTVLVAEA